MDISFICGHCGKAFQVGAASAGQTGRCKRCGRLMFIPTRSTTKPVRTWEEHPAAIADADTAPSDPVVPAVLPRRAAVAPSTTAKTPKRKRRGKRRAGDGAGWAGVKLVRRIVAGLFLLGLIGNAVRFATQNRVVPVGGAALAQGAKAVRANIAKLDGAIALPPFPEVGVGRELESGVTFHEVILGPLNGPLSGPPGQGGRLWLYLPTGNAAARSLPCVMMTGAGSNLLIGMALGEGDRAEHLPYVRAGFAVLAFELDGAIDNYQAATEQARGEATMRFLFARAGLVNAHVALEYALRKVPAIDPKRISVAGHSSAAVLALLFAANEPRLKSAVAFAPAVDLEKRFGPAAVSYLKTVGGDDLAIRYSPVNNINRLQCPVFLFQASDDSNTPAADAQAFVDQAQRAGKDVTFDLVPSGGHYESMIRQGIPDAIAWLGGKPIAAPALAGANLQAFQPTPASAPRPTPTPPQQYESLSQIPNQGLPTPMTLPQNRPGFGGPGRIGGPGSRRGPRVIGPPGGFGPPSGFGPPGLPGGVRPPGFPGRPNP